MTTSDSENITIIVFLLLFLLLGGGTWWFVRRGGDSDSTGGRYEMTTGLPTATTSVPLVQYGAVPDGVGDVDFRIRSLLD